MIEVIAPDGTIVRFPEGTPQDVIINVMRAQFGGPEQDAMGFPAEPTGGVSVDRDNLDVAQNRLGEIGRGLEAGFRSGLTFGFDDEAIARVAADLGGMPDGQGRIVAGDGTVPRDQRYEAVLAQVRANDQAIENAAPFASGLGEVIGMAGPGAIAAGRMIPAGAGLLRQMGVGAGVGATEGLLAGIGNADGENAVANGMFGGLLGGVVGGVAPGAVSVGRGVGDFLGGIYRSAVNRPGQSLAARNIARVVNRSGQSVDDLQRALDQAGYDAQEMFILADALGRPGQRALSGIARQPGEGADEIAEYLARRQAGQADRLGSFVGEALDTSDTARIRDAAMRRQRGEDADVNYDAARDVATPVDVRDTLAFMDQRLGPMAGSNVDPGPLDLLLTRYRNQLAAPSDRLPEGVSAMELSDFGRVLEVKQSLQDDIGAATRAGRGNEARLLMNIRDRLDAALESASTGYRRANDTYRAQSQALDAIETGTAAAGARVRTDDALNMFRALPEPRTGALVPEGVTPMDPRDAFRTGFSDPLLARIENSPPGVNSARMFTTPKNEALFGEMANDPALWNRRLQREMEMFETNRRALGGSMTNDNMQDSADMSGGAANVANFVTSMRQGGLAGVAADLATRVSSVATGTNEATRNLIAQALLSRDPERALRGLLDTAQRTARTDRAAEGLLRAFGQETSRQLGLLN